MQQFHFILDAYRLALSRWRTVLFLYVVVQALAVAVIAPTTGLLVNLAVQLSDQSALTDQDIAMFLLTPGGFVATLSVVSLILATQIGSFAVMAAMLRLPASSPVRTLRLAIGLVVSRFRPLTEFALRLILRVLGLSLPFVLAGGGIALWNLTEFDINYYLTNRPPEFLWSVVAIGGLGLALAFVLLLKLSDWAVSAHLVLFGDCPPAQAFAQSRRNMHGVRGRLQMQLVIWFTIRVVLTQGLLLLLGALVANFPLQPGVEISTVVLIVVVVTGVWVLTSWGLAAIALGALAVVLDKCFGEVPNSAPAEGEPPAIPRGRIRVIALGIAAAAAIGLWISASLLSVIQTKDNVEIIAHRGAAGTRPENTIAAIEQALVEQADWVEIDVQESRDGQVVVIHDADFMKLAGNPVKVWDADYAELSEIDIGSWFDPAYSGENPPLLSDVLAVAKGRGKVLIELKYYGHDVELEQRVVDLVEAAGMAEQVALMSLKYPAVLKAQELRPDWRTGVLAASAVGNLAGLKGDFLAVRAGIAGPRLIRKIQESGKDLYVWTVNDPLQMSQVISEGVDGIITDEPGLARKVLEVRATLSSAERMALWLASELGLTLQSQGYRDESP